MKKEIYEYLIKYNITKESVVDDIIFFNSFNNPVNPIKVNEAISYLDRYSKILKINDFQKVLALAINDCFSFDIVIDGNKLLDKDILVVEVSRCWFYITHYFLTHLKYLLRKHTNESL